MPEAIEASGLELIGYSDCDGRPPFKMALAEVGGRWLLFCGHLWHRGWTVMDVTEPTSPRVLRFIEGPAHTWTAQVQVADGLLVAGLSRISPKWGGDPGAVFAEAAAVIDVRDPEVPREIDRISFGGRGSHRSWWTGGRYAYLSANAAGFSGYLLIVVDLTDPAAPQEVARWWLDGQREGEPPTDDLDGRSLHGPAYVLGDRAYLSYGGAGVVILDVTDPAEPTFVSRMPVAPPFRGGPFGAGVHTARPLIRRPLVIVHGEAGAERCEEPLNLAGIVDVSDERQPALVSTFPRPRPGPGLPYRSYCEKGGRFGPHDSHLPQGLPLLDDDEDLVYLTWFNAGLRIYDIRDAREPIEIAWYVPSDPVTRYGPLPASALVTQSETVLVDRRGCIYLTDKNAGLAVLRLTESPGQPACT